MNSQANIIQSLGWALLNSLWQLALLWIICQVILILLNSFKSHIKSFIATFFLFSGFAWFIITFISFNNNPTVENNFVFPVYKYQQANTQLNKLLAEIIPTATIIYLAFLIIPIAHFIRNYRYVKIIRQYGISKAHVDWRMFVNKFAFSMGIKNKVQVWVSEFVSSPVTVGFLKPVILIPLASINHLTTQQMEAVLLHELSHIRRKDYLINLIIVLIESILYFNPFVKAFIKIIEQEREKSCDEMVLQFQYNAEDYATALINLEKSIKTSIPMSLAVSGNNNNLFNRIEIILGLRKKTYVSFNKLVGILALFIAVIAFNTLLLTNQPVSNNKSTSFTYNSNPLKFINTNFFDNPYIKNRVESKNKEITKVQKQNVFVKSDKKIPTVAPLSPISTTNSAIQNVNYLQQPEIPRLKKSQEEQVKQTLEASKKIFENAEWKAVEINIAEVLTQDQKEELKESYLKEMDKFDWNNWGNKLRLAYDNIDWDNINSTLSKGLNNLQIDSLQKVYTQAISTLDEIQQQLLLHNLKGIPDSDISLQKVEENKKEAQKYLIRLKSIRNKKIVHL